MSKPVCAAAVFFFFALTAAAQPPARSWNNVKALSVGTSVRISVGSRTVNGQVHATTDDSLALDSKKGQEMFTRQEVMRVSVKKTSHRGRNTLIGLGAGAGIGVVVGVASLHQDCTGICFLNPTRGQAAGIGAILFGVIGTAVGALIPTGGWREVYKQQ
jgi:hypothetical protein